MRAKYKREDYIGLYTLFEDGLQFIYTPGSLHSPRAIGILPLRGKDLIKRKKLKHLHSIP